MSSSNTTVGDVVPPATASQPRGVEQHGVEPIPKDERTVGWWYLFQILINTQLSPGLILSAGLAVVAGVSFWGAVGAHVLGILLGFTAYTIMATVGVDYGLPGIVATRAFVGIGAARWLVSTVRAFTSAFWFAFQTLAGAMAIAAVLNKLFDINLSLVLVSVLFAILQASVALLGYASLSWLSRIAFPTKVLILGYLIYVMIDHGPPGQTASDVMSWQGSAGLKWVALAVWVNSTASAWFSQATDAADYCRYSKNRRTMWIATMGAVLLGSAGASLFGAYAAAASGATQANAFEFIAGLPIGTLTLVLILIVLVLDNWTINVLNVYTGGLSLNNLTVRLGRFWSTIIVAAAGTTLAALPQVVTDFTDFTGAIGSVFGPLVGIIIADYLIIKRGQLQVAALYEPHGPYRYQAGFNLIAIAWTAIGTVLYYMLPVSTIPVVLAAICTAVGYVITVWFTKSLGRGAKTGQPVGPAESRRSADVMTVNAE